MEYKWKRAKKPYIFFGEERKISPMQFIEHIASHSSSSGKPYKIKLKDQKEVTTKQWLLNKLKEYKAE